MIVVDSAVVIDLLTVHGLDELRDEVSLEELHAPSLIDYEVVSGLRGLALGGHISSLQVEDALRDFDDLPLQRWPSVDGLRRRVFQLRHNVTAYDAAYLALAEALDCPLLTRDGPLGRATGHSAKVRVL